jgi:hypothetical protein
MNYERPEGYDAESPQVLVRQGVIKWFGEVAVKYESLSEYFESLKKPADRSTVVLYRSGKFGEGVLPKGLQHTPHLPFSNTWHVNTWRPFYSPVDIERVQRSGPADVMSLLIDRMFHSVDVDTHGANPSEIRRVHRTDISFPEFPSYPE